ncbi:MAG: energy transducer TonB [Lautropia sp.]
MTQAPAPAPAASTPAASTSAAPAASPAPAAAPAPPLVQPRFDAAYLRNPAPRYPVRSRRLGEQGETRLRVCVTADGRAESTAVARSSGFDSLDAAAVDAVAAWRFVPARRGDTPVAECVIVPIRWRLDS